MSTRRLLIATFLTLAAGAAMQAAPARELPEGVREFAADQQQEILIQGRVAHEQIRREIRKDMESDRMAFVESQMRDIEAQGAVALAEIKQDLDLIRFEGVLARLVPRPVPRNEPNAAEMTIMNYYDR